MRSKFPDPDVEVIAAAVLVVEPGLDQQLVTEAVAATAPSRRQLCWLDQALSQNPDCLVSGDSSLPLVVAQLIRRLQVAGASRLMMPRCARCGQPRLLRHKHGSGRICDYCERLMHAKPCVRCGDRRPTMIRTGGDPVCCRCRRQDRGTWRPCSQCRRLCRIQGRSDDGRPLCYMCAPRRLLTCAVCGRQRRVHAYLLDGPTCGTCYDRIRNSPQACPGCGEPRVLQHLDE